MTELVRDPRWIALCAGIPRVDVVHDDRPHDAGERRPAWERALFGAWNSRADTTLCFSEYVAQAIARDRANVEVVPLASDITDADFTAVVSAAQRRDFIMLGRLNEYKNIDVVLRAWEQHRKSPSYRGDILRFFGAGEQILDLPDDVWWNGGSYDHGDVIPSLMRAKGSLAHYRVATQSGVQVLSMQAGVMPIVSTEGALPEFQPPEGPVIDKDDVAELARAFDSLADPLTAALAGGRARQHYGDTYAVSHAAVQLQDVLSEVVARASRGKDR